MNTPQSAPEPKLQKPGAGLPWLEGVVLRYVLFPSSLRKSTWESNAARFAREGEKILARIEGLSDEDLARRVLVARLQGMEDSSRHWSVAMTVEHLMMVGRAMGKVIVDLSHGRTPPGRPEVAAFKPAVPAQARATVEEFRRFVAEHVSSVESSMGSKESLTRFAHPWLGPTTLQGWMWLMASHQGVHRRQVDAILAGLGTRSS
jgi:uncharacterized damage-inducible protein DinB